MTRFDNWSRVAALAAICIGPLAAHAADLPRQALPPRWLQRIMPEDLPELEYPSYYNDLDKAEAQLFFGRYKLALVTVAKVKDADPIETALIKAAAQAAAGWKQVALETLSDAALKDHPGVQVLQARILGDAGKAGDAIKLLRDHLKVHPDSLAGHYHLGELSERVGDLTTATDAYGWFIAPPQEFLLRWQENPESFENAEEVTTIARALDRHSALTGAYQTNPDLHNTILNMFVRAYDVIDREYWPAHVAAAEYFVTHDDLEQAVMELKIGLNANPGDLRGHLVAGRIALDRFDFDTADHNVAAMRNVDPRAADADVLEARSLLRQRLPKSAEVPLKRVLERQPDHLEALGLLAASAALRLKEPEMQATLRQIDEIDPDNATAYFDVAEQLGGMRQYPRSAEMYKIAIERAPWWTAPRNGLGLLYTQSGDEEAARVTLDAAHKLDPFNLATTNYLRLLDDLAKFAQKETEHFIVFYDASVDPVIPEYFAEYLESIYPEVVKDFQHEPKEKTLIEVFPTHDGFSVRTTGSPWIGTVGASTGRVIALVAPRKGKNTMGPFHWGQVLKHEFTHTVTLSATDNRIAHWMTEGLAVLEEKAPLRWEWVPMLYHAVKENSLFTMEGLTWGFIRPRKPNDRTMAYAQSYWICKYIQETHGHDALLKMLVEFRDGASQDDVFPKVLGKSIGQFEKDFFAWTEKQVSGWGYDKETSSKYDKLVDQAESLVQGKQYEKALDRWQEIARLRPVDALPHQRLAGLYIKLNQPLKAVDHLIALHLVELKDNRYAKRVSRIYRDAEKQAEAERFALEAVYIDPYDLDAHELLAELYALSGNDTGLSRENRVIKVLEEWHQQYRKSLMIP